MEINGWQLHDGTLQVHELVEEADANHDGVLQRNEFASLFRRLCAAAVQGRHVVQRPQSHQAWRVQGMSVGQCMRDGRGQARDLQTRKHLVRRAV